MNIFKYSFVSLILLAMACKQERKSAVSNSGSNKHIEYDAKGNKTVDGYLVEGKRFGVWKYYNNNNLTAVKQFKNDTLQYELNKDDFDYKEIFLKEINAYIPVPKNWIIDMDLGDDKVILTSVKNCSDDKIYCPNFMVVSEIFNKSLEQYIEIYKKQLTSEYTTDLHIVEHKKNTLVDHESYELRYLINNNDVEIAFLMIWFKINNRVITFSSSSEKADFPKNAFLFLEIGNSITYKK